MDISTAGIDSSANRLVWDSRRLWSLWDMLSLNASAFYRATTTLSAMAVVIENWDEAAGESKSDTVAGRTRLNFGTVLEELEKELITLDARITLMVVRRLISGLDDSPSSVTYEAAVQGFNEIQSRLRDELSLSTVFALRPEKARYYKSVDPLFGPEVANKFPGAGYDIDEAGKCLALSRPTASVFHSMRTMEIGIHAVRACLGIPAPVKDWERNWGKILKSIADQIATRNGANPTAWASAADKEFFASVRASLDAVRVAWRNTTMHVESKYTEDEAEHIFGAVRGLMKQIASRMDELGQPSA